MLTCYTVYILGECEFPSPVTRSYDYESDKSSNTTETTDTSDKEQAPYEGKVFDRPWRGFESEFFGWK